MDWPNEQWLHRTSLCGSFATFCPVIEIAAILAHDEKQAYFDVIHYQMPP